MNIYYYKIFNRFRNGFRNTWKEKFIINATIEMSDLSISATIYLNARNKTKYFHMQRFFFFWDIYYLLFWYSCTELFRSASCSFKSWRLEFTKLSSRAIVSFSFLLVVALKNHFKKDHFFKLNIHIYISIFLYYSQKTDNFLSNMCTMYHSI